jgi:hypothetical protein
MKNGSIIFKEGDVGDALYIITEGSARVFALDADGSTKTINSIGPGECFGEMALLIGEMRSASILAESDMVLFRLTKKRFDKIVDEHHSIAKHFMRVLAKRLAGAHRPVARAPKQLHDSEPDNPLQMGSSESVNFARSSNRFVMTGLGVIVLGIPFLTHLMVSNGFQYPHIIIIDLLVAAMLCWTFGLASFNLVSVALPVLSLMLGATSVSVAYSGFANRTFFLLLGIYAVVAALSSTGLIFRASLWLIRKAPLSYLGQTLTLAVTGLLLTPLLLSGNARVALVSPLALDLSEALRLPNRSPGTVGLAMTGSFMGSTSR